MSLSDWRLLWRNSRGSQFGSINRSSLTRAQTGSAFAAIDEICARRDETRNKRGIFMASSGETEKAGRCDMNSEKNSGRINPAVRLGRTACGRGGILSAGRLAIHRRRQSGGICLLREGKRRKWENMTGKLKENDAAGEPLGRHASMNTAPIITIGFVEFDNESLGAHDGGKHSHFRHIRIDT